MADNRDISSDFDSAQYNSLVAAINYQYAKKFNYDFIYYRPYFVDQYSYDLYNCLDKKNNTLRHASWSKILCAIHASSLNYDYIVYIDSDCIFKNFNISISTFISNHSFYDMICLDSKPWGSSPCAGFFICKVSENSLKILKDWYAYEIPHKNLYHPWEQDALQQIYTNYNIANLDLWMFKEEDGQFLRHICSAEPQNRVTYFKNFILNNNINFKDSIDNIKVLHFNTNR